MLNWMAPWPFSNIGHEDKTGAADTWSLESAIEAQTRLWNHMLDANRSLWLFYAPWLQTAPWWGGNPMPPTQADAVEVGMEPAETVDGLPDALESQARTWNHFLDAQRTFLSALNFEVPGMPWSAAAVIARTFEPEPQAATEAARPRAERPAAKRARAGSASKSRTAKSR